MESLKERLDAFFANLYSERSATYMQFDKEYEIAYLNNQKYRYLHILENLPRSKESFRVLDIGTTPFTFFIKEYFPHYEVCTLDLTELMEKRSAEKGIRFKRCDLAKEPIPYDTDFFDVVIFSEVLEHLFAPPSTVLAKVLKVMRNDGTLFLSVPNVANLISRLKLLVGINPEPLTENLMKEGRVHGFTHLHLYSKKELTSLAESCSFNVMKSAYLSPKPFRYKAIGKISAFYAAARVIYDSICFLVPPFRDSILLQCKAKKTSDSSSK
jgi:SAM-dependent methyltransferase